MANEDEIQSVDSEEEIQSMNSNEMAAKPMVQNTIPVDQSYHGGMPPLRGARRPSGMVKVDQFGNEIDNPFEKPSTNKDITQMPEFIEAFGGSTAAAIKRSSSKEKSDNRSVTIIHGEGKPMDMSKTGTGVADPKSIN